MKKFLAISMLIVAFSVANVTLKTNIGTNEGYFKNQKILINDSCQVIKIIGKHGDPHPYYINRKLRFDSLSNGVYHYYGYLKYPNDSSFEVFVYSPTTLNYCDIIDKRMTGDED